MSEDNPGLFERGRRKLRATQEGFQNFDNSLYRRLDRGVTSVTRGAAGVLHSQLNPFAKAGAAGWKATKAINKVASLGGIGGLNVGLSVGLGLGMAGLEYDSTKHDAFRHFGAEAAAFVADDIMFAGATLAMGMMPAMIATTALYALGANPGQMLKQHMSKSFQTLDDAKYGKRRTVQQNQRTMAATQSQLALLGQAGNFSMLGNEAQMMHT